MNKVNVYKEVMKMVMPKQSEMEVPLLEVISNIGGQGTPKQIYEQMALKFPQLTKEELEEKLSSGINRWQNRIQWVRQSLVDKGDMYSPERGIWGITDQGRNRISSNVQHVPISQQVNFYELYEKYEEDFASMLLDKLYEFTPRQFEEFAKKFLQAYGFVELFVTDVGPDGGIDGYGRLKIGLASMSVAFQCKRWQGNIGRQEIQKFRGAIQGSYEQGIFFTTSDFTTQAKEDSFKRGAVPVILLNGESIVKIMIEKGLGVERRPLYLYDENIEDFLNSNM